MAGVWEVGSLAQVFWTDRNEEWYTKRLASIGEKHVPFGMKYWRDEVRGYKDIKKAAVQHEVWSQEELGRYISPPQ